VGGEEAEPLHLRLGGAGQAEVFALVDLFGAGTSGGTCLEAVTAVTDGFSPLVDLFGTVTSGGPLLEAATSASHRLSLLADLFATSGMEVRDA
jgi:hypothetical protein